MFRKAPAPSRSHNSFTVSCGLLNIPVSVMTGTEETAVKRSEFAVIDGELHSVGRIAYVKDTGEVIDDGSSRSVNRYAFDSTTNQWVLLGDHEIEACTMPKKVAEVITFVPLSKLYNSYLPIGLAQVRARTSGLKGAQRAQSERAFGLFLAGLKDRKVAALVKVALRGPARFAAITPDGDLLWLQASDGVRASAPVTPAVYTAQEMSLVGNLIDTVGKSAPVIIDDTAEKISEFVADKAQRMLNTDPSKGSKLFPNGQCNACGAGLDEQERCPTCQPASGDYPDLMAALTASIDAIKVKVAS